MLILEQVAIGILLFSLQVELRCSNETFLENYSFLNRDGRSFAKHHFAERSFPKLEASLPHENLT